MFKCSKIRTTLIYLLFIYKYFSFKFFRTDANISNNTDQNAIDAMPTDRVSDVLLNTPTKSSYGNHTIQNIEEIISEISLNEDDFKNVQLCEETDHNVPLTPKSAKRLHELSGRRIIEIFSFIREIQNNLSDHGPFECTFKDMNLISETRSGLQSKINFECKMCGLKKSLKTNNYENVGTININEAAVVGTLASGGGYSHFSQIFSAIDIPVMSSTTYSKNENKVSTNFEKVASKMMLNAAIEEKTLAIENNEVDKDGVPLLTVICDGSWGKRSYRTMYNSSSGTVSE